MTILEIQRHVARHHGITVIDLLEPRRQWLARNEAMWIARVHTGLSYPVIARTFRRRYWEIAVRAVQQCDRRIARDVEYGERIGWLVNGLGERGG